MSLPLKVKIRNLTKTMNFAGNMSIAECCKHIREKIGEEGGQDHGLFQPAVVGRNGARWLKMDRTLQYYDLQPNDEIEYKKKHRPIKIKLQDETIKTILVDDTLSVGDIVAVIGEKMSISNADEFSLKVEGKEEEWLNTTLSLQEQGVGEDAMLLLRKKYFVTDGTVSIEDPVSLHLVFVESRDNILKGQYPCTQEEALMFAALQCQIQLGNYDPQNPKKFNAINFLPPQFVKNVKKLEPMIIKEYRKLVGMQEANAKYRYVQVCRSLKTYGITFYNVKQKMKGGKKPRAVMLGVTRSSVLFMDAETKEVFKESPFQQVRRWAAAPTNITFDFGDHEDDYIVLTTNEAEAISALLAGYIDILLKKRNEVGSVKDEDDTQYAQEEPVAPIKAKAMTSTTTSLVGGFDPYGGQQHTLSPTMQSMSRSPMSGAQMAVPTNLVTSSSFIATMISDLSSKQPIARNTALTPEQWRRQLASNAETLMASVAKLNATSMGGKFDRALLDGKAAEIAANLAQLVSSAKNAAILRNGQEDPDLMDGAKRVAEAIRDLLSASKDLAEHPDDPKAMDRFQAAQRALNAANAYLASASKGVLSDGPSQKLLLESAKNVLACAFDLANVASAKAQDVDPTTRDQINSAADKTKSAADQLNNEVASLAPSILHTGVKNQVADTARQLEVATKKLQGTLRDDDPDVLLACKAVADAIGQLLATAELAEAKDDTPDFSKVAKDILDEAARLMNAQNPAQINQGTKALVTASTKMVQAVKQAASLSDDQTRDRLLDGAKGVALSTQKLVQAAGQAAANPNDPNARQALNDACQRLSDATKSLVGNAAEKMAHQALRSAAKVAVAATTGLVTSAKASTATCSDPVSVENLKSACKFAGDGITKLVHSLQNAWLHPNDLAAQHALIRDSHDVSPQAYKLVAASKSAVPKINDLAVKQLLKQAADDAAEALQKLVAANKAVVVSLGQADVDEALERFAAEEANLDAALLDSDAGNLKEQPGQTAEGAMQLLNLAAKGVANATKQMATTAKTNPDELGAQSKNVADSIGQVNSAATTLASHSPRQVQADILHAAKQLTRAGKAALTSARSVAANPTDPGLSGGLTNSTKGVADALTNLLAATKGSQTGGKDLDEALQAVNASVGTIKPVPANAKEFPALAEDVENNIKAVQAAVSGLLSAVKTNPKLIGQSAKTVQSVVPPLVQSSNRASGAVNDPNVQNSITNATKNVASSLSRLLGAAKNAAMKDDPNLRDELNHSGKDVATALENLIVALNAATPGQSLLDEALRSLNDSAHRLASNQPASRVQEAQVHIEEIKRATAQLGEATKGIISNSRNDAIKVGQNAKNAAEAIAQLVQAAGGLAESGGRVSAYQATAQQVKDVAKDLVSACQSKDPNAKQAIVRAAKDLTVTTQQLVDAIKSDAQRLEGEPNRKLMLGAQSVAESTSKIVNAAKAAAQNQPGARDALIAAHQNLERNVDDLLNNEAGKITTPKSKKLVAAAQETATSTTNLIDKAKGVLRHPEETQSELAAAARNVGAAMKNLLEVAKSMGEIDLDQFIEKVAQAIADLDAASISATVGLLENTAPPGKTTQSLEEDTVEMSRELATAIKDLVNSQKESPTALAKAAAQVANLIPKIADLAKQGAGTSSDQDKQLLQLTNVKTIADFAYELLQACKQNDPKEIANQAKNCSGAIAKLLGALKGGVIALREADEATKIVADLTRRLDSLPPHRRSDDKSYSESQRALTELAKQLVGGIAKVVTSSKTNPQEVGDAAKKVATTLDQLVNRAIDATEATEEERARQIVEATKAVTLASSRIIQNAKLVSPDPKNVKNLQKLSESYQSVTDSISKMIQAIKAAATGELKAEAAADGIARNIADLDGAALYAATNQLQPERDDMDIEEIQNDLLQNCQQLSAEAKNLSTSAKKTQNELGESSQAVSERFDKITKDTRTIASLLNNLLNQQNVLASAKAVGAGLSGLISDSMKVHHSPNDPKVRAKLEEQSRLVENALKELVTLAQTASSLASSGVRELEQARKAIRQALDTYDSTPGNQQAGAVEVLKAAKGIADGVAAVLVNSANAEDPSKFLKAIEDSKEAAKSLLINSKGAVRLTKAPHVQQIIQAAKAAVSSTATFMEAAKASRKQLTAETQRDTSEASEEVVRMIGELVEVSKVLPGSEEALKLFQEADELEQLAESELLNAASSIENAAKQLYEAKQRQLEMRKNKDSPLPEEQITEAILDAAKAITAATGILVNAASAAQKELVAKGKVNQAQNVYRRDPAWARGLISAAQSVAGSVGDLVGAANDASMGKGEDSREALVASAKGVAAATARLVFASRAKADPLSQAQQKLSAAAKSVAAATHQLVVAAEQTVKETEEETPNWDNQKDKRVNEMEQQMKILKLQKELETAQFNLGKMRKEAYADAVQPTVDVRAASASQQPAKRVQPTPQPKQAQPSPTRPTPGTTSAPPQKQTPQPPTKNSGVQQQQPQQQTMLPPSKNSSGRVQPKPPVPSPSNANAPRYFPLEYLQTKPKELDGSKLELYLSDEDFGVHFGMDKRSFAVQSEWKRNNDKTKLGLF
eukprot:TRINITY_DN194_c0_g1_i3.p1 TRINITY_DN194_c0_g1~~TRINITY_DN194_c0_g1_i3.p1  ORF type:complete len:2578 (-),score=946.84 TRINITY_DN194_c0_g1_i3:69-7802(-)